MRLIDKLRKAEQQGRDAVLQEMERVLHTWDDAQTMIRRKMRVYPHSAKRRQESTRMPAAEVERIPGGKAIKEAATAMPQTLEPQSVLPESEPAQAQPAEAETPTNKPIVTVHGKDVEPKEPAA